LSEVRFTIKVVSIHPSYDAQGNEYVCVEFGFRPPRMPTVVPANVPKEVSDAIRASNEMVRVVVPPQLQAHMHRYANRLTLYLSMDEWESLQQKYTVGDEFEVSVENDGSITMKRT